jgi:hypothetical protein
MLAGHDVFAPRFGFASEPTNVVVGQTTFVEETLSILSRDGYCTFGQLIAGMNEVGLLPTRLLSRKVKKVGTAVDRHPQLH